MKFAAIALIAVVAAHETAQPHSHTAPAEEEREHRHHHDGGDDKKHHKPHHPHHKPHHPHHKPHHEKKTEGALKADIIQLEQIVVGVLKGAVNAEGFNDIATCIADLEHVLGDATTAVKDFKAGGATNVINGLKVVGDLIATVKTGMADCSQTTADW
jgi:hypothetical protein